MQKYRVVGVTSVTLVTEVEAASYDEARELAEDRGVLTLCHQCSDGRNIYREWVTSGELDGEPEIIEVKKLK